MPLTKTADRYRERARSKQKTIDRMPTPLTPPPAGEWLADPAQRHKKPLRTRQGAHHVPSARIRALRQRLPSAQRPQKRNRKPTTVSTREVSNVQRHYSGPRCRSRGKVSLGQSVIRDSVEAVAMLGGPEYPHVVASTVHQHVAGTGALY